MRFTSIYMHINTQNHIYIHVYITNVSSVNSSPYAASTISGINPSKFFICVDPTLDKKLAVASMEVACITLFEFSIPTLNILTNSSLYGKNTLTENVKSVDNILRPDSTSCRLSSTNKFIIKGTISAHSLDLPSSGSINPLEISPIASHT